MTDLLGPGLRGPADGLWRTLSRVRRLGFVARSAGATGWNGSGQGTVLVEHPARGVLTYDESGVWRPDGSGELKFRNVFRWTLLGSAAIRLEHLRFGPKRPVLLFELIPTGPERWQSQRPHLCGEDSYGAELWGQDSGIEMVWSITGPKKAERIEYEYGGER